MLTNLNVRQAGRRLLLTALVCGAAALSVQNITQVSAQTDMPVQTAYLDSAAVAPMGDEAVVRDAAASFVRSMSQGDVQAIWMFASEEEQEAFASEDEVYAAFAETFPALTQAKTINVDSVTQEGDTPFVQVTLADEAGNKHQANVGLWLDDAGDWKVISCEVTSLSDRVASL